jgi:hypothetical protein
MLRGLTHAARTKKNLLSAAETQDSRLKVRRQTREKKDGDLKVAAAKGKKPASGGGRSDGRI